MTDIPNNPATALERIFTLVRETGSPSVRGVWTTVLDAQHGTPEFYRRHGEVVTLITRLHAFLQCLPEDSPTRSRNIGDVSIWYAAVVPTNNWEEKFDAWNNLIPEHNVRLLGALGETLSARSMDARLTGPEVVRLTEALAEWKLLLADTPLPDELRIEIQQQLEHIEWLLGNARMLGYEPVIQQSRSLFAMSFSVVKVTGNLANVATAVGSLFQLITHISVGDYGQAMNALSGLTSSASEVFAIASEQERQEHQAIGAKEQKSLAVKKAPRKRGPRKKVASEPTAALEKAPDCIEGEVIDELPETRALDH